MEAQMVPISALQHYVYCPRQCALIHLEQTYEENIYTLRGNRAHERVHDMGSETSRGRRVLRGVPLWSERLGLVGKSDVIEVAEDGSLVPIEHKVGPRKERMADDVQVCAQALCIEEMTGRRVLRAAIYHHASKRRRDVDLTPDLRTTTERVARLVHEQFQMLHVPPPVADARCRKCSLLDACMPHAVAALARKTHDL